MNLKQLRYSQKKVRKSIMQTQLRMFLFVMLIIAIPATVVALTETENSKEAISVVGGTTMASMFAIGNIEDVPDVDVAGSALSYRVWLIEYGQIDQTKSFPKPNLSREMGAVPLKSGEAPHYFVAHDIPEYTSSGERGDLTINATNTFTIIMGGLRDQLLNFIEQYAGAKFIVIFQECGKEDKYILGNACKPMVLKKYDLKNNKENRSVTFTFESNSIRQYFKYKGDLSGAEPALHAAGQKTLAINATANTYRIPNGTSATYEINAVSGLTSADEGRFITLVGEGTDKAATVADSAGISLKNGATWTASAGSQIIFQVFDAQSIKEISRS